MKKVLLIVLLLVLGAVGVVTYKGYQLLKTGGFGTTAVRGSGNVVTEARTVGPFTSVDLSGIGNAFIVRGGTPGLSVKADDNLLPLLISEVRDGTLHLSIKDGTSIGAGHVEYRVTAGDLREIDVSGAANLQASGVAGAALTVEVSGAAQARLSGRADKLTASVSGAGELDAAALAAKRATVTASGAASVSVNVSDALDAHASGAGSVHYLGTPKLTTDISGAGSVAPARR